MPSKKIQTISIVQIVALCADYFETSIQQISGRSRQREIVKARFTAMYLCRHFTGYSLKTIAETIAERDHSTVIHALKVVKDSYDAEDDYFKPHIEQLTFLVNNTIALNKEVPKKNVLPCVVDVPKRPLIQSIKSILFKSNPYESAAISMQALTLL
jgi:hypothetical protein